MATGFDDQGVAPGSPLRLHQERQVALSHSLTAAEYALAEEASVVGRAFEQVGIAFDPVTFVVLRILEGSLDEQADPIECLRTLGALGLLDRSVARAVELLERAA
jgi:hypothetical protein